MRRWDVDDWLGEIAPEQLDELIEAHELGAFDGDDWLRTGWMTAAIVNKITQLAKGKEWSESDWQSPLGFMPASIAKQFRDPDADSKSIDAYEQRLRRRG